MRPDAAGPSRPHRDGSKFTGGVDPLTERPTVEAVVEVSLTLAEMHRSEREEASQMLVMLDPTSSKELTGQRAASTPDQETQERVRKRLDTLTRLPAMRRSKSDIEGLYWDVLDPWTAHDPELTFPLAEQDLVSKTLGLRLPHIRVYVGPRWIAVMAPGDLWPNRQTSWYLDPFSSVHNLLVEATRRSGKNDEMKEVLRRHRR